MEYRRSDDAVLVGDRRWRAERDWTSSFENMLLTWRSTVRSLIPSSLGDLAVRPAARPAVRSTSTSRPVSCSAARAGPRPERTPDPGEIRPRSRGRRTLTPRRRELHRGGVLVPELATGERDEALGPSPPRTRRRPRARRPTPGAAPRAPRCGRRSPGGPSRRRSAARASRSVESAPTASCPSLRRRRLAPVEVAGGDEGSRRTARGGAGASDRVHRLVHRATDRGEARRPADPARGGGGRGRARAAGRHARRP